MAITTHTYGPITRKLSRGVNMEGGGWRSVPDGQERAEVLLSVDLEAIAYELGQKAMRNKSGKAKAFNGLIVVKALKRQRIAD